MRLIVVPRWGGTPASDFYPWLVSQLAGKRSPFDRVTVLDLPRPDRPEVEAWTSGVGAALGRDGDLSGVVLMGHSVGCQAALRALAALEPGQAVRATLLVAGWWTVDRPWETIVPWIETPFDTARARAAAGRLELLLSDDDPFTADHQETARLFQDRLGAGSTVVPGGKHFNGAEEPAVLAALARLAP